ncbi:unnamed protein product [Victoria cruziana]
MIEVLCKDDHSLILFFDDRGRLLMKISLSLILMNHFPTLADPTGACKHDSAELLDMIYEAASESVPNFIAVDFYEVVSPSSQ